MAAGEILPPFCVSEALWREWWLDWETGTQSQNPSKKWILFLRAQPVNLIWVFDFIEKRKKAGPVT
ncbi:MAG: hypothetical protein IKO93_21900 [Lentisphaeria bacterium]|nr:hypothetical protein [Lentisphaeria bacterium]